MMLTPYLHLALSLIMCGAILLPIVCLHDADRDNLICTFSLQNFALVEDNIALYEGEIGGKLYTELSFLRGEHSYSMST
jgi:hypothetical protein